MKLEVFLINCSNSSSQPQPLTGNVKVTNISIQGQIESWCIRLMIVTPISGLRVSQTSKQLSASPVSQFSVNQNKFVAVGYDTYAFLNGNLILNGQQFSVGCLSQCQNISNVVNGSCSRIGCCQLDIPQGLKNVYLETYNFKNHTKDWDFNPCSFAFIIREDKFNFSSDYLISLRNNETLPMVTVNKDKS